MPPEDNIPGAAPADISAAAPAPEQVLAPEPVAAPVDAPIIDGPAEPAVEAVASEPVADAPAEPSITPHTETTPGLLGADKKPDDVPAPDKPTEPAQPDPAAAIVYEAPILPEGISLDAERLTAADTVFRELGVSGEGRQRLIDMYVAERQADAARTLQSQHDAFAAMKGDWAKQAAADAEIGGAGFRTSIETADSMIRLFTTDQSRAAFLDMLRVTGADSHPEMIRFLVNVGKKFNEPAVAPLPHSPPPDLGRRPNQGRGRLSDHYDNPRSQEVMRPAGR